MTGDVEYADLGAARRLATTASDRLHFVRGRGWLTWRGDRWAFDEQAAQEIAKDAAAAFVGAQATSGGDLRRAARLADAPRLKAALTVASSDPALLIEPSALDANPWLLNVPNGTVELRTGHLREHDPADLLTTMAGAPFKPDARSLVWERFLRDVTGGDADLAAFLQRAAGYTLVGLAIEEVVLFAHGPAASGKTTFGEALKAALGEYATTVNFATFLAGQRRGGDATPDLAALPGVRMAAASEVSPGQSFDPERLKTLTGGDTISARPLYGAPFAFRPQFTTWLAANDLPAIPASDSAMWRRLRLVPFAHAVPEDRRNRTLKTRLTGEEHQRAAVLAWAVAGCLAWARDGLGTAEVVTAATGSYRASQDPIADFLASRCVMDETATVPGGELRAAYVEHARAAGDEPVSAAVFARALEARGFARQRTKAARLWRGVRLQGDGVTAGDGVREKVGLMRAHGSASAIDPSSPVTRHPGSALALVDQVVNPAPETEGAPR